MEQVYAQDLVKHACKSNSLDLHVQRQGGIEFDVKSAKRWGLHANHA
jgi:hypothetical protein